MVMSRGAIASLATGICLALSFPSAAATPREQTEEIFGEILAIADDKLNVLINDAKEPDVKLGELDVRKNETRRREPWPWVEPLPTTDATGREIYDLCWATRPSSPATSSENGGR